MATFTQVTLFTDTDGRARWREHALPLNEGTPQAALSALQPSGGELVLYSPPEIRTWHCAGSHDGGDTS